MRLIDSIYQRASDRSVIITDKGSYTAREVLETVSSIRIFYRHYRNASVVLHVSDVVALSFYLIAFDGWLRSMTILPVSVGEHLGRLTKDSCSDHVIEIVEMPDLMGGELLQGDVATKWVIPTSGTTNVPKLVEHDIESLASNIKKDQSRGGELVWCMLYDLTRFAGLQVYLQAVMGGSSVLIPEDMRDTEKLEKLMKASGVNALSATPSMWRKLLMQGVIDGLELGFITLGGEIADSNILDALSKKFDQARITHVYASTEAGFGFSVTDKRAGFPCEWQHVEMAGVELKVENETLYLKKSNAVAKYISTDEEIISKDGWINTGDMVRLDGDRYIFVGRENGAINVGGQKVQAHEVESVLLSHVDVLQAAVMGKANPFMGSVVIAEVVSNHESPTRLKKELLDLCRDQLADYKVPAIFKVVEELKLNTAGKIKRT